MHREVYRSLLIWYSCQKCLLFNLIVRKQSDKFRMWKIPQSSLPEFFIKCPCNERQEKWLRLKEIRETWQLNTLSETWLDPG